MVVYQPPVLELPVPIKAYLSVNLQERVLSMPPLVYESSTLVYIIFRIKEVFCNWSWVCCVSNLLQGWFGVQFFIYWVWNCCIRFIVVL